LSDLGQEVYINCVHISSENVFLDLREMYLIILGSTALATFIWFLLKKDPEPLLGVYSQPGITSSCVVCTT